MTLPFEKEVVNDCEYSQYNFEYPNFIGYLNNYGAPVSYRYPLGLGGHNINGLTAYFEQYFQMPTYDSWAQFIEGKKFVNVEFERSITKDRRKEFKEKLETYSEQARKYGVSKDIDSKFMHDLDVFFYNCYQADTFMEGFGQNCIALNQNEFYFKFCENKKLYQRRVNETDEQYIKREQENLYWDYRRYKKHLMLDWYKDVIVQYIHYHLVERCNKGITTSDLTPYETFYNYILNDFTIHPIPRMIYDETKKMYVPCEQCQFLISDNELRLKEELQAIKKLVPIRERSKYYR